MHFATKSKRTQILTWLIWALACLLFCLAPEAMASDTWPALDLPALTTVITPQPDVVSPFPWTPKTRWRKWAYHRYCVWRRVHQRAVRMARLAQLRLTGALTLAQLIDLVTEAQFRRHLGALPVLYTLLERLQVRAIINRHCPTRAQVDHGTVALVLILNRLVAPRALCHIADWLASTVLVHTLGIPASKFNDDRLARTLDAIQPHCTAIWQEVVDQALQQTGVDLSVLFYDLTACVVHGAYQNSRYVDFGFANNTPMSKRKFKVALNVTKDGRVVTVYLPWTARTSDMATVPENISQLARFLERQGRSPSDTTVVGDRANVDDKLALAYDDHGLHYVSGLRLLKKVHKALVEEPDDALLLACPLTDKGGAEDWWGIPCQVPFEDKTSNRKVVHRGLVVLSGRIRTSQGKKRAKRLQALEVKLNDLKANIGQRGLKTEKQVQHRANVAVKASKVKEFVHVQVYTDEQGQIHLDWQFDLAALQRAMHRDGRYLLVSNNPSLTPQQMLTLYHQKDGVEKDIGVLKKDLKVSPVYLHKDNRLEAMLLIHMLSLLAYTTLERQVRQGGLQMTTRRIIDKLKSVDVIETHCLDGSRMLRLVPLDDEQVELIDVLAQALTDPEEPSAVQPTSPTSKLLLMALPPPPGESTAK